MNDNLHDGSQYFDIMIFFKQEMKIYPYEKQIVVKTSIGHTRDRIFFNYYEKIILWKNSMLKWSISYFKIFGISKKNWK